MKLIKPAVHAWLDYLVVAALWLSPSLFLFTAWVSTFTYALGTIHLLLTVSTNFPGGLIKIVPLKIHGLIELLVAIVLSIAPWSLSNITSIDKYFYLSFALVVFVTWLLTDYTEQAASRK